MATIRKRGEKYHVQVRRKGFPTQTKSFGRLAEAKEWARQIEAQTDKGEVPVANRIFNTMTLAQLVMRYRDEVVPLKKGAEIETIILNAFLRHRICETKLANLTTANFAAYRDERLKEITSKSLKRQLSPLSNMFEYAIDEWQLPITANPLTKLRLKVVDNRRERRLRDGELQRLLSAASKVRNSYMLKVIKFALATAMRRGEILALRWKDVDSVRRTATILEAKNGYTRVIPLSPDALGIIASEREDRQTVTDYDFVFPIAANTLRLSWDRIVKKAQIVDLHFHDLRHEAISGLFEIGLTAPEVACISGHRDMRMLFRYAHATHASIQAKFAQ